MTQDNANHDAVPAARAFVGRPRTDKADLPTRDGTGNTSVRPKPIKQPDSDRPQPINEARLAALEELSALDQKLELEYGLTGNPMIKAQPCKAAKTDTTQPRNGTLAEGSAPRECTEPTAEQVRRFTERLLAMGGVPGRFWPQ